MLLPYAVPVVAMTPELVVTDVQLQVVANDLAVAGEFGLLASCSIVLNDGIVIYDIRLVNGARGPFVGMPSQRVVAGRCQGDGKQQCGQKYEATDAYCRKCGRRLPRLPVRAARPGQRRVKMHVDIVHPITQQCRDVIHAAVLAAYRRAVGYDTPRAGQ